MGNGLPFICEKDAWPTKTFEIQYSYIEQSHLKKDRWLQCCNNDHNIFFINQRFYDTYFSIIIKIKICSHHI